MDALPTAGILLLAGGLTDVNLGLTIWTIVLFLLFAGVLTKFGWKPILAMIEEREKSIQDSVAGAQRASTEAQALLAQHQELVREAGRQREDVIKRAIADAEALRADLSAKARAESEQLVKKAREQIEREKTLAIQELRGQVADLAMAAAAKIVTTSLTPDAQKKLVQEFIDTLPRGQA
jgi:F-type H+-transporting ATPase subunit b